MSTVAPARVRLTEDEFATLIRESTGGKFVEGSFGPGWVDLTETPANDWARKRVEEMRAAGQVQA